VTGPRSPVPALADRLPDPAAHSESDRVTGRWRAAHRRGGARVWIQR